jgi:hypothetical protein
MRGGKKSLSVFNYILAMWITLVIGFGLIGAAPWLGSRAKGKEQNRRKAERQIKEARQAETSR